MEKHIQAFLFDIIRKNYQVDDKLLEVDQFFYSIMMENPSSRYLALYYNEFRLANADKLPKDRPRVLIGGSFNVLYPNFHHYPLFTVADVVCLTCNEIPLNFISAILCRLDTSFANILNKLPKGFKPDFYWDNQIEHQHYIPLDISTAPFPIIASVCHTYLHQSIEHVCELFDRVLPLSKEHGEILRKKYPEKIIDLPFGLNWASFDHLIEAEWNKSIDVFIAFKPNESPIFLDKRKQVLNLAIAFKEKYGNRFNIKIVSELPYIEYIQHLKMSAITVNVTGIHGPYNYRTMEAICAGSLLFQYQWDDEVIKNNYSELFVDGIHGFSFTIETFESKLLELLENPNMVEAIAKNALNLVKDQYGYRKLYKELFKKVKEIDMNLPRIKRDNHAGNQNLDMIYYYQNNQIALLAGNGVSDIQRESSWIDFNNLMIYRELIPTRLLIDKFIYNYSDVNIDNDDEEVCKQLYNLAISKAPEEFCWIVNWNYLLLTIEIKTKIAKKVTEEILSMLSQLEHLVPQPFDETRLFFKYYLNIKDYPFLAFGQQNPEFYDLNIRLLKNIDKPKIRAGLYRDYAMKKTKQLIKFH